ncbi:MAG TPA: Hpt domain-containing protein, partial [Polyangiaceae bacterium]
MARDPYKYFRVEAREVLDALGHGALQLEKGAGAADLVVQMLRLAHTLKGAARVVGQPKLAELAHAVEDVLESHRKGNAGALPSSDLGRLLPLLDAIGAGVAALGGGGIAKPDRTSAAGPEPLENVRVAIGEMDALLEGVIEAEVRLTVLRRDAEDLSRARGLAATLVELSAPTSRARLLADELLSVVDRARRKLTVGLDHADRGLAQVRGKANELRLVPASAVFASLERAARDAAKSLGKSVGF